MDNHERHLEPSEGDVGRHKDGACGTNLRGKETPREVRRSRLQITNVVSTTSPPVSQWSEEVVWGVSDNGSSNF